MACLREYGTLMDILDHIVDEIFVNLVLFIQILDRSRVYNHVTVTQLCMLVWFDNDECMNQNIYLILES